MARSCPRPANSPRRYPGQPVPVGVIGVGNMGQHHARVFSLMKDVQVVGVADINVERGLDVASRHRVHFYEDYRDLLPHVAAVAIAVPTVLHHEVGIACLEAGVHVLIEKPIAASIAEAESLVNRAADCNCILQVGHIERFSPVFQKLGQVLQSEEPLAFEAHRLSPYSDRASDVSVVFDLMIHDIDLLLELIPSPVTQITASGNRASKLGYLDYVTATLTFANGAIATLTASKVTHRKVRKIAVHCKNALVEADFLHNEISIYRQGSSSSDYGQVSYQRDCLIEKVHIEPIDKLHAELEHFINCVRGGSQPSVGGEQALKALKLASEVERIALDGCAWREAKPCRSFLS
ncbi:putative dehydrogenase [Thermostichus sp. MS-CIW-21]|jgi:predicted dehydrogenase|uniref:Gfo/Idh/MocA family protein n=1 Tax=unclassified Synechococcus TaxID=2626047 RepID=UPI0000694415|nr:MULTISPECIES: Gfo/Idh/MocA family oxidoreductase [unclassified Synechococcus]ABC99626.1 oxidoreductase, NAD-binding [Synechococcus sp. JA-3-3Ab]PIK85092.1 oxidoreductase [Synechococcus sp. 63AY4M2]PIK88340.1 oxidoreductase [Synechococcus sp. 65AY6A5]PIK92774.1 oxidoreductase [Synechococcus sp. 65AY6Li]PIK94133.1 oxidoreductase [Synechococcus sp. 60AY4M2]